MATNTKTAPVAATTPEALTTVKMTKTKETKGAVRYDVPANMADGSTLTNLYVRKEAFQGKPAPEAITVTIAAA